MPLAPRDQRPDGRPPGLVVAEEMPEGDGYVQTGELMRGAQTDFYLSTARHPALLAGRGAGKTFAFAAKAFQLAVQSPGVRGCLTEPTFDMIRRNLLPAWEKLFGQFGGKRGDWEYRLWQQGVPAEIVFPKIDVVIDLRPADSAEKFRGPNYGFWGMDEIAVGEQLSVYLSLTHTLRQEGYPLQGFVTSTPSAQRPWIKKVWEEHVSPFSEQSLTAADYPIFRAKTRDNFHLPPGEYQHWLEIYGGSRLARQELEGEFVSLEGLAFEEFGERHIKDPPPGHEFVRTLGGLDFGATNPTALYELRLDRSDKLWVTREFYKRNADDYDWLRAAAEWGLQEIICDPSRSEQELLDLRRRYQVNLKRAQSPAKRFADRVHLMRNRLAIREDGNPRMYVSASCPNLIGELRNLAYDQPRVGEFAVDRWAPGVADHGYDAVAYGISVLDLPALGRPRPHTIYEWVAA